MGNKYNYSHEDYQFMNSLSSAILEQTPKKFRIILWFWIITISLLIAWAYFAQIDEIVRGEGKVIPRSENKMIQNLEGGIIEDILVKEGDLVKKGEVLLKIDNQKSKADYESTNLKAMELTAKIIRLQAETNGTEFVINPFMEESLKQYVELEKNYMK